MRKMKNENPKAEDGMMIKMLSACVCKERKKQACDRNWVVMDRKCNYSAFSGYRYTPSDYSCVECLTCGAIWRTKAKYVDILENKS